MEARRVLVVDDDRDLAESLAELLSLQGHTATPVFSGRQALAAFQEHDYDLVLMDVRMPGKDGLQVLTELRAINPAARIVMMTGYALPEMLDTAVARGAWNVLHKPLDMARVFDLVERVRPGIVILVVDDDPDYVESTRALLQDAGFATLSAPGGRAAIEQVRERAPSAMVLDLHLPDMAGIDVYRELQSQGDGLPTVIVTAFAEVEDQALRDLPGSAHPKVIDKPFEPEALVDRIRALVDGMRDA